MKVLELKVPPVALFVVMLVSMYRLAREFYSMHVTVQYAGWALFIAVIVAGFIGLSGVYEFRKAKTTVNPVKIETASAIVDSGIYAYTRNPMYLALVILLIGFAIWLQNVLCLLGPVFFVLYMNRFQIQPEERMLERLFGHDYLQYKHKVRRWV